MYFRKMISSVLLVLIFVTQHKIVLSKPCKGANCNSVKLPVLDNQKAYLFAEMDVSSMNEQLQEFIQKEINSTYNDRIADTKDQIAVHSLEEFTKIQKKHTTELLNVNTSVEKKLETVSKSFKQEMKAFIRDEIKLNVAGLTETVSMTACLARKDCGRKMSGQLVRFSDVSTSSNINNLPTFINSGKFEVGVQGTYLISVSIFAVERSSFSICKSGEKIVYGYMYASESHAAATAVAIVAINLKRKDEIWVQTEANLFIHSNSRTSCLTLIKVK